MCCLGENSRLDYHWEHCLDRSYQTERWMAQQKGWYLERYLVRLMGIRTVWNLVKRTAKQMVDWTAIHLAPNSVMY